MYALYVQDDFRIHDKVTLNLGLRWEYEGGLFDPEYRLPRDMDLSQPIPGMQQAIDPLIPADVRAIMAQSAGANGYTYNGAFYFTDEDNPRNVKPTLHAVHAAPGPGVEPRPPDGDPRRLRPLLHAADAGRSERHDGPARSRRVQPGDVDSADGAGRAAGAARRTRSRRG